MVMRRRHVIAGGLLVLALVSGCSTAKRVGMRMIHTPPPPAPRSFEDLAYRDDPRADAAKHRLDLFLPAEEAVGFPIMVFVHGGALDSGDKDFEVGGVEVYGDLGRYFAARGIGVATISYRLQPSVDWVAQADDVARAVGFVAAEAASYGAGDRLVLAGHSAGAWLAGRVALDPALRARHGLGVDAIDAVVGVSGVGFDMADELTWELDGDLALSERRFRLGPSDARWRRNASLVPLLEHPDAPAPPPFLLIHTRDEWRSLARQNALLHAALQAAGARTTLIEVKGGSHARMVLRMSEPDRVADTIESFIWLLVDGGL